MCTWRTVQGVRVKTDCHKSTCTHSDSYIPPADRPRKNK